jgi:hypothetical protein
MARYEFHLGWQVLYLWRWKKFTERKMSRGHTVYQEKRVLNLVG